MVQPAPGRACGDCNACCGYYEILSELNKPCASMCGHWKAGIGCGIYETRPKVCRDFYCQWLLNPDLSDWWRPDRCGVILRVTNEYIPPQYAIREGLMFELCGDRTVIAEDRFILAVASLVQQGVPAFLSITGPMGFGYRAIFLNDIMAKAVASGVREHLATLLRMALEEIKRP